MNLDIRVKALTSLLGLLLGLSATTVAAQGPRVAVLTLEGRRGQAMTRMVRTASEEFATVLETNEPDPGTNRARGELARRIGVDLVIAGSLSGPRRRPRLTLVFVDAEGQERASVTRRVRAGRRGRRVLRRVLSGAFDEIGPLGSSSVAEDEPDFDPFEEDSPVDEPVASDDGSEPEARDGYRPWLKLLVGAALRTRYLTLETAGDVTSTHRMNGYPELLIGLDTRPLALAGSDDLLYGLRVRARFSYALYFESSDASDNVFGGSQWGFEGGVGFMFPLADILELGPMIGGGIATYDVEQNMFVPSVSYSHLDVRVAGRLRVADEAFVIQAEAAYRYAGGGGDLPSQFGDLGMNGVALLGGIGGSIPLGSDVALEYALDAEFVRYGFSFGGMGSLGTAEGGSEEMFRASLTTGVSFQ